MTKTQTTATESTYQIVTYVDGVQEWAAETITAGQHYELGDNLDTVCADLAETAWENTTWVTQPRDSVVVAILSEYDTDNYELARGSYPVK